MARITRKELKTDKFALEVEHTVTFFEEHRKEIYRYGGIALAIIALVLGYWMYSRSQHAARENALFSALQVQLAPVGPSQNGGLSFATQEAKDQAAIRAFSDIKSKYSGSAEGAIAAYYLGSIYADEGKLKEAESNFQDAAKSGNDNYSSMAKMSLAQIYYSDGRDGDGEKILRDLISNPTVFVSKEQATIALARQLASKQPAEARKLLQPLLSQPGNVGQVATNLNNEIPR